MVSCGGQATIPMVAAVNRVSQVHYAEIVSSIASKSAGPGTRANIDEFTQTTARAIEKIGGAKKGKAIIVLNPAEPPLIMRNTVFCFTDEADRDAIGASIKRMVEDVQGYVPGYRLKQEVQFENFAMRRNLKGPDEARSGLKTSIYLEIEGAGHYLPPYAGNLDIMTSAALKTAERLMEMGQGSGNGNH
jgi:acetaldehyde dehydrogenase